MQISDKKVVTITYDLYTSESEEEFEIVEVVGEEEPMVFLVGFSGLPEDFEKHLLGKSEGDEFEFTIGPQEGFGQIEEEDIADFPLEMFKIENGEVPPNMLDLGNFIPFTNDDGSQITGRVHAVDGETVRIDFNHPLAGKSLRFEGRVISIREATQEEIDHGHVHGEGGVHHH